MRKLFSVVFLVLVAQGVSAKERDMFWICASSDDPRAVTINYPLRGAALVEVASNEYIARSDPDHKTNDGRKAIRFNFDDYNQSMIIVTERPKKAGNFYRAGLYNFAAIKDGESTIPIDFLCLSQED
jgi:hypothetical protein